MFVTNLIIWEKYCEIVLAEGTNIEILCFIEDKYGTQATIVKTNKQVSTGVFNHVYSKTLEDSLQIIVLLIEKEIKDDDWVKKKELIQDN